jgi:pyridoxamine 5'-phosphate oxidase
LRNLEEIRRNYQHATLNEAELDQDPMNMFYKWWDAALDAEIIEPNAMTLSTVNSEGQPSARIVLLKTASADGFEFYTNYQSQKAIEIDQNPKVALVFLWKDLERQIRIEGIAEKAAREKSQVYFQSRPRGSQIGAWASPQSTVIPNRTYLEKEVEKVSDQFENVDPLPCPDHWGGYLIKPHMIEFWQGRSDRLHDRIRYTRNDDGNNWKIERLAP